MSDRRVVITGLGAVCSLGSSIQAIWDGVLKSRSGIGPITLFDASDYDVRFSGECHDFDPLNWMTRKEVRRLDRFVHLAVAATDMAVKDAGLEMANEDLDRFGCILGSGIGGLWEIEEQFERLRCSGPGRVSPFLVPKMMINAAPGEVSIRHGVRGPNVALVTACASSSHALGEAFDVIQRNQADVIISGGSEAAVSRLGLAGFCSLKALSTRNDDPEKASRPFDLNRDGFVIAEGGGGIILEELEHARARGARIYAEFAGFGMSGDACHITAPDPNGSGPARAMQGALTDAQMNSEEVDYINAHGTSTPLNDKVETKAIKLVFGDHARELAVSSSKSQMGHMLGASGAVELVITCLAVHHQVAPPTINYETPDPECDLDYVPNEPRQMRIRGALSNSFGFGGHNASIAIRRFDS